ncbi:MAG: hypothetical protein KDD70_03145 [Bdellovibrionales bacterium]|nr:hypothetical protein [Bdellovibrionales bacterium]
MGIFDRQIRETANSPDDMSDGNSADLGEASHLGSPSRSADSLLDCRRDLLALSLYSNTPVSAIFRNARESHVAERGILGAVTDYRGGECCASEACLAALYDAHTGADIDSPEWRAAFVEIMEGLSEEIGVVKRKLGIRPAQSRAPRGGLLESLASAVLESIKENLERDGEISSRTRVTLERAVRRLSPVVADFSALKDSLA